MATKINFTGLTLDIEEFKAFTNNKGMKLRIKPWKDGYFFTCGRNNGAVSKTINLDSPETFHISECNTEEGSQFWLLHNSSTDNVILSI